MILGRRGRIQGWELLSGSNTKHRDQNIQIRRVRRLAMKVNSDARMSVCSFFIQYVDRRSHTMSPGIIKLSIYRKSIVRMFIEHSLGTFDDRRDKFGFDHFNEKTSVHRGRFEIGNQFSVDPGMEL